MTSARRVGAACGGALALLAGGVPLAGCSDGDDGAPRAIALERVASRPARPARFGATPEERFGFGPMASGAPSAVEPVARDLDPSTVPFAWDVPPGWAARTPTSVRLVNLVVEDDPSAECYVTLLPGDGGGLTENVNRWRAQMELAPIDAEAVRALPRIAMFGTGATLVDLAGPFQGMSGPRIDDARMLGAILTQPEFTLYVKMTGPAAVVERERGAFEGFCRSLRVPDRTARAQEPDPHAGVDADPHAGHDHAPGEGHGDEGHGAEPTASAAEQRVQMGPFVGIRQAGWVDAPGSSMRLATFRPEASPACDISVTVLAGDGGGLLANVNRWLGQFEAAPLDAAGLAALETVEVLGQEAVLVEAEGPYTDMSGNEQGRQGLLGMACLRGPDSLFVKLVGPADAVEAERERFVAFVRSLEVTP